MTEEAEAAGARIASSASRKARTMPGEDEGSASEGNDGSSNRSKGVHEALMRGHRAGATTQHPMAAAASRSTSPLTRRKRTMKPLTSYEFRRRSSSSLEAAWCTGMEVAASSLVVLELSATSREARPPLAKDGRVADEGVGSPPRMEARRARALAPPWGVTSKDVGSFMKREERGRRQPHEVRRASRGAATS